MRDPDPGHQPDAIDLAEDRERFAALVEKLGLKQPANGIARSREEAVAVASRIGYPVLMRPSYVLGGRAMEIVDSLQQLEDYITTAVQVSGDSPVLIDQYLRDAIECDVDALCDGERCAWPVSCSTSRKRASTRATAPARCRPTTCPPKSSPKWSVRPMLALALGVKGLMNIQFAVKDGEVYLIEVNPRASRTVPFVAKALGQPVAKIAARVMAGEKLSTFPPFRRDLPYVAVKEAVFPFARFAGVDPVLSPR
jgi:carbamoyl-phosphate synthase large subunit